MVWKRTNWALYLRVIILVFILILSGVSVGHAAAENLIRNAGFEDFHGKTPRDWRIESWTQGFSSGLTPGTARQGKHAVFLDSVNENDVRYIQTVSVKPNTVYRFSGWIATRNVPPETLGANLSIIGTFVHSAGVSGTNSWTFRTLLFRTGSGQREVTIAARLGFYSDTTAGSAYFDDLKLEKVTRIHPGETVQALEQPSSNQSSGGNTSPPQIFWPLMIGLFYLLLLWGMRRDFKPDTARLMDRAFGEERRNLPLFLIMAAGCALILRVPLLKQAPFPGDLACFENWALRMVQVGPANFFQPGFFCDYPPFGLILLWPVGWMARLFSLYAGDPWFHILIKVPGIVCDFGTAWLIYALFRGKSVIRAQIVAAVYLFIPAILYNSAYWGQVDSYYTFLMLSAFYVIVKKENPETAAALVTLSFLTKAQTVAFLPLLFVVLFIKYPVRRVINSIFTAFFCFVLVVLPFGIGKPVTWIISHYTGQASLYPYASLNAANFLALIGGNEIADSMAGLFGIPFNILGIGLFLGFSVWMGRLYFFKRTPGSLAAGLAMSAFALFLFFPRMHERYLFPTLAFLLVALGYYRDRKILFATIILSISYLFNLHGVVQKYANLLDNVTFNRLIYISAIVNTAVFCGLAMIFHSELSRNGRKTKLFWSGYSREVRDNVLRKEELRPFAMERRDYGLAGVMIAAYAVLLFLNLGSWKTPQTGVEFKKPADGVEIRFTRHTDVNSILIYDAEGTGSLRVESFADGNWRTEAVISCNDYYVLRKEPVILSEVDRVRLVPQPESGMINEIAFLDPHNQPVSVETVIHLQNNRTEPGNKNPLFDEQSRVLVKPSFLNSTYFDEIYHGRTAYEFVTGSRVYETTHPPFGKDLLALGILLFGMNPFGMRLMHAVAGLLLIVVLFILGREVLKTRFGAYGLMFFGMLDFMPLVQSRYATIDSTSVLLITLMFLLTFRWVRLEAEGAEMRRILVNLFWMVFFFALAAGTKWTAIYGSGGVLMITGYIKMKQYRDFRLTTASFGDSALEEIKTITRSFKTRLMRFLIGGLIIFLLVAPSVYFLAYLPFLHAEGVSRPMSMEGLQTVIKSQSDMYQYHSRLKATHPFSSSWWGWPFDFKPLWLYMDKYPPDGMKGSIVSFGNPVIWALGTLGAVVLLYQMITGLKSRRLLFIFVCFLALYLPWILISRVTFIYHFYPALPWFYIFGVIVLEPLWTMNRGRRRKTVVAVLAAAFLLLLLYYPVLTGLDVPQKYIDNGLRWFERDWIF